MKATTLILAFFLSAAPPNQLVVRKFLNVSRSEFSKERLIKLSNDSLKNIGGAFAQVTILGEGGGPPLPKPTDFDFQYWQGQFEYVTRQRMQIAEAISINRNAVLRIHQADGSTSRQVLSGQDPLRLTIEGEEFEIVYVDFSGPHRLGLQESVFVFVRALSPLRSAPAVELFKKLEPLFPGLGLALEIRDDAWFVYQPRYPFVNPFIEGRRVPSQQEYETLRTMHCVRTASGLQCDSSYP